MAFGYDSLVATASFDRLDRMHRLRQSAPTRSKAALCRKAGGVLERPAAIYFWWNLVFAERCDPMTSPSPMMPAVIVILLLLAAFFAAGLSFGFIQTLLIVAIAASAAMLSAFLAVAWSRQGY
jgi:hypothetical protein